MRMKDIINKAGIMFYYPETRNSNKHMIGIDTHNICAVTVNLENGIVCPIFKENLEDEIEILP